MSQRGAFILNSVGHKQLTPIVQTYTSGIGANTSTRYVPIANSWESAGAIGTYGWWVGGGLPTGQSIVDRIDFSNDSPSAASPRGLLRSPRAGHGAASNSNYGWFGGGLLNPGPGVISTVMRIDYANDSPATSSFRGPLNGVRNYLSATSNANYGWFGGGEQPAPAVVSTVERIDFSNDSPASPSPRGSFNVARTLAAAAGNANYGWWASGAPFPISSIERIDYANDLAIASSRGNLLARVQYYAAGDANYGWFGGGIASGPALTSQVHRIDYSNDSLLSASPRGPLTTARSDLVATSNANYIWFAGGSTPTVVSTVDRIDFSNDTATGTFRGPMSTARNLGAASSNYVKALPNFVGVGSVTTGTFGIFGTPSSINTSTGIAQIGGTFGWNMGGLTNPSAGSAISTVDRIDYANDSPAASSRRGSLPVSLFRLSATSNNNYGWTGGGNDSSNNGVSFVFRSDFANDLTALISRGPLATARNNLAATGNADYGWFMGGNPAGSSIVERITYSNDSPTSASPRGPLTSARTLGAATGNANYAWFIGGAPGPLASVDRIDFSNDSPTAASRRGLLSATRYRHAAVSNSNYGYVAGGGASNSAVSTTNRIDFSNDSPTAAITRGNLTLARTDISGSSNADFGWFSNGLNNAPAVVSIVDRLDFSNDTAAATARGPSFTSRIMGSSFSNYTKNNIDARSGGLNVNLYAETTSSNTATGVTIFNGTFGWTSGTASSVERIDFATDSATATVRGPLSLARMFSSTTHNTQYGWFIGGLQPASPYARYSTVDRIDYANDSPTAATVRGNLSIAKAQHTSMGNINYGWVAGGETLLGTSSLFSSVDRIDYSNESPAGSSPRGPLTAARGYMDATANEYYGWVAGGGFTVSPTAYSTVERIDFANDSPTAAASRSRLQTATYEIAGAGNRNYGWFNRGGASTSLVERLDFSNDTVNTLLRGSLSQVRTKHSASSNSSYGWWIGGFVTPNPVSTVDRIDFSNDSPTASAARGPLAATRYGTASASNYVTTLLTGFVVLQYNKASAGVGTGAGTYGWFAGGTVLPAVTTVSTVDRIDFSNDSPTSASPRGPLATARSLLAATGNANYGWFGAGPSSVSTVERIDFGNDSPAAASPRGPLSVGRSFPGATGNASYGWFAGGGVGSIVDRIDFANDSPTAANPRGPLSAARSNHAATGNANYGWFGGGSGPVSTVDRIDFSNDSPTAASRRGLLSAARRNLSATGNIYYGWFGGGNPGGGAVSTVDRIDFANDSPTAASARGLLSAARYSLAASGNANYGWFSSGSNPAIVTAVDRIDFSSDSPTIASARGLLSAARYNLASSSNYVK